MNKTCLFLIAHLSLTVVVDAQTAKGLTYVHQAIVRGDSTKKQIALVFTADEFGEGLPVIIQKLRREKVKAGFFFTGRFFRNPAFKEYILQLKKNGHYLGPHSDNHLLYCDWAKRDSLLVTRDSFSTDLARNVAAMRSLSITIQPTHYFIPPFEWWNATIAQWVGAAGFKLFNFTPGTFTPADYTWPEMEGRFKSSEWIIRQLKELLSTNQQKLNGAVILIHAGTDPRRKDKLYDQIGKIVRLLRSKGFSIKRIDELLQ